MGGPGVGPQDMGGMPHGGPNQPHATEYTLQGATPYHFQFPYPDLDFLPCLLAEQKTNLPVLGVMRFLQTEWHRHERDRNSWEIERQEMKGRIAALEGSARRSDATQKALKRYVAILEKKVKDQAAQLKAKGSSVSQDAGDDHAVKQPLKIDRLALIQEKLKCECYHVRGVDV